MNGMPGGGEGGLRVRVQIENGAITAVALHSTRPVNACSILVGRRPDEAMALLPRLFSLCGVAQTVAGLRAVENALDLKLSPSQTAARQILVVAEALDQTAWRLLLDWPRAAGVSASLTALKRLRQCLSALRSRLFPDPAWNRIGGSRLMPDLNEMDPLLDSIDGCLCQSVYGLEPGERWPVGERRDFERWLSGISTPVTLVLRHVRERGLADFGHSDVLPLPAFDAGVMEQRLGSEDGYAFCARPEVGGVVYETGALARLWGHPLIVALRAEYGNGLFTRLVARLIETCHLVNEVRELAAGLEDGPGIAGTESASGAGLGVVECARGRLVHRVAIAEGRMADYKILAPTEWNFHPEGPLARGLAGARAGRETAEVRQTIEWLVAALDPCVACDLVVEENRSER